MIEEASKEIEFVQDPFLESGVKIPDELPYADEKDAKNSLYYRLSQRPIKAMNV